MPVSTSEKEGEGEKTREKEYEYVPFMQPSSEGGGTKRL